MPFSEYIIQQAWQRAGGRCECVQSNHGHTGRCNKQLLEMYRGDTETQAGWEAQSKSGSYSDLPDCEILCWDCQREIRYL